MSDLIPNEVQSAPAPEPEPLPPHLLPPQSPDGYTVNLRAEDGTPLEMSTEGAALLDSARAWAHSGGLPAAVVEHLAETWQAPDFKAPSAEETSTFLHNAWGDRFTETATAVGELLDSLEKQRPGLLAFLDRTGLGNDPILISELGRIATRRK